MKKTAPIVLLVIALGATGVGGALALEHVAYSQGQSEAVAASRPAAQMVRYSFADTSSVTLSPDQPETDALAIFDFVRSGRGRLAIGPLLVLIVWATRSKKLLGRFAFWKTTLGGYLLGFGSTALLYAGTTIAAGTAITFNMVCDAFVTAFAASGKWEALRDAINGMKAQVPPAIAKTALVMLVGAGIVVGTGAIAVGCAQVQKVPGGPVAISCLEKEGDALLTGQAEKIKADCSAAPDVATCLEGKAESAGITVGGCILAQELSKILTAPQGVEGGVKQDPTALRQALDKFHARVAHGVVYQTAAGPL